MTTEGRLGGLAGDAALALDYARTITGKRLREGGMGRLGRLIEPRPVTAPPEVAVPPMGSVVELDGIRMRVDPRMSEFNLRKLVAGRHTAHERALLAASLRDGDRVLELGGGIGMVAISCARRLGPGRVMSYEANPELEPLIRDNYALNDVAPELRMAMVEHEAGTRAFHISERFSQSSAVTSDASSRTVEVPVHALREVLSGFRPSVMVVDIQGSETELLGRATPADLEGVRMILVEIHPFVGVPATLGIRRNLRSMGFGQVGRSGHSFVFERAL